MADSDAMTGCFDASYSAACNDLLMYYPSLVELTSGFGSYRWQLVRMGLTVGWNWTDQEAYKEPEVVRTHGSLELHYFPCCSCSSRCSWH